MANKIKLARATKSRIEEVKATLENYEIVYSMDTNELGVKNNDGTITYFGVDSVLDDKVDNIESIIFNGYSRITFNDDDFEIGTFTGTGLPDARTDRLRSKDFHTFGDFETLIVTPSDGYKAGVYRYSYNGNDTYTLVNRVAVTSEETVVDLSGDYFYKFLIAYVGDGPVNESIHEHVSFKFEAGVKEVVDARTNVSGVKFSTVGERLSNIEDMVINELTTLTFDDWVVGTFTGTGLPDARNDRLRSDNFHSFDFKKLIITPKSGYKAGIYRYTSNGDGTYTFVDRISMTPSQTIVDLDGDYFYKFLVAFVSNEPVNVGIGQEIIIKGEGAGKDKLSSASSFEFTLTDDVEDKSSSSGSPLTGINTNTMYSLFDTLMTENPRYISKNLVGYGSNSQGVEDQNSPIYEYVVSPYHGASNSGLTGSLPTIIIVSGIHGNEKASTWAIYETLKKMFDGNVGFNQIRANCKLKIIPILNRYGFDNNVRTDGVGTDINRDFLVLSTNEANVLSNWMQANEDALAYIDYHNTANAGWFTYLTTSNHQMKEIYSSLVRTLAPIWQDKYGFDLWSQAENEERFVFIKTQVSGGSTDHALNFANIKNSVTLEVGNYDPTSNQLYTKTVLETAVDLLINMLLSLLRKHYY